MLKYISVEDVLQMHAITIDSCGGAHGMISYELLDSAVNRMHASFDGNDLYSSIYAKAAALFQSLCKNHCFVDGNKRTAIASVLRFFFLNEIKIVFEDLEMENFVIGVAKSEVSFDEIVEFFKEHSQ